MNIIPVVFTQARELFVKERVEAWMSIVLDSKDAAFITRVCETLSVTGSIRLYMGDSVLRRYNDNYERRPLGMTMTRAV